MSWGRASRISYGNKLVNEITESRVRALKEGPPAMGVTPSKQDRGLLMRLATLREDVRKIERVFASRHLQIPANLTTLPTVLDRTHDYKRAQEQAREKRTKPAVTQIYKLRQQVHVDLLSAKTKQEQGMIIAAFVKAIEQVGR